VWVQAPGVSYRTCSTMAGQVMRVTNTILGRMQSACPTCNGSGQIWTKPAEAACKDDY
jgi:molecular chaperone DnaJ